VFALRGFPQVQLQYVARFVYRVAIFVSLCYFQRNFLVADGAAGEFVGLGNQAGIGLRCTCFVIFIGNERAMWRKLSTNLSTMIRESQSAIVQKKRPSFGSMPRGGMSRHALSETPRQSRHSSKRQKPC